MKRRGLTLIGLLIVVLMIGIVGLMIDLYRRTHSPAAVAARREAAQKAVEQYSYSRLLAYQEIASYLLEHPARVSSENWKHLAMRRGYEGTFPGGDREHSPNYIGNLHFLPWGYVLHDTRPASEKPWAYEVFRNMGKPIKGYEETPCLFLTIAQEEHSGKVAHEMACLVVFADGHTEGALPGRLRQLGLLGKDEEPIVYVDHRSWQTLSDWQKSQTTRD